MHINTYTLKYDNICAQFKLTVTMLGDIIKSVLFDENA